MSLLWAECQILSIIELVSCLFEILDERSVWSCCVDCVDCIETWHKKEFEDRASILIECLSF